MKDEDRQQDHWLNIVLAGAAEQETGPIFVFMHRPLFIRNPVEPGQKYNINRYARRQFIELFQQNGVLAVFAGHFHKNVYGRADEFEMIVTGSVGKPFGRQVGAGFHIVKVYPKRIEYEYLEITTPNPARPHPSRPFRRTRLLRSHRAAAGAG